MWEFSIFHIIGLKACLSTYLLLHLRLLLHLSSQASEHSCFVSLFVARWSHLGAWVRWWKTYTQWIYISWIKGETEERFPLWAGFYHQCEHLSQHKLRLLKLCTHVLWEVQLLQLPASLDQPRMKAAGSSASLAGIAEPRSGEWQALKLCVWPCSSGMWENTLPLDFPKITSSQIL